jgi:homocysteine S-methyltransferase
MVSGPIAAILARRPFVLLDGGLATELERRGVDLLDPLWSAKALLECPERLREIHLEYLRAGSDVVTTASYQATFPGLMTRGLSASQAGQLIGKSLALAREARDEFRSPGDRPAPLVAGSIGSYGAYLHDGSEFTGDYRLTAREFKAFHRARLDLLVEAGADLLACETMPARREVMALVDLLEARGDVTAWISFTARDGERISDGNSFAACVAELARARSVVAVGVNCVAPDLVAPLLERAAPVAGQPFVVYPNGGGAFDAESGRWSGDPHPEVIPRLAPQWHQLGARLIGGCCRTGPSTIEQIRSSLEDSAASPR